MFQTGFVGSLVGVVFAPAPVLAEKNPTPAGWKPKIFVDDLDENVLAHVSF